MKHKMTLLALALAPLAAFAAEDAEDGKLWTGEANLSYIDSSGNTESTNLAFRSGATRDGEDWRNIYKLEASNETAEQEDENGNKEEVRTAEKNFASAILGRITLSFPFIICEGSVERILLTATNFDRSPPFLSVM